MVKIKPSESVYFEKFFEMGDGYVLDFSNRTFDDFIFDVCGIKIYEKYPNLSKAKILRQIISDYDEKTVGELLLELIEYKKVIRSISEKDEMLLKCKSIANALIEKGDNNLEKNDSKVIYDAFICHASEDKEEFARPFNDALIKRELSIFFDEMTIEWGDQLIEKIEFGISCCKYGVIILSPNFFKNWPLAELDAFFERQKEEKKKIILPLFHKITVDEIKKEHRFNPNIFELTNIMALSTDLYSIDEIADKLEKMIKSSEKHIMLPTDTTKKEMMKIQKLFEIFDNTKDDFLREINKKIIINLLDKNDGKTFDDLFIMPNLLKKSYYDIENNDKEKYTFDEIIKNGKNLTIYGKKEFGKTTLAYKISKYYFENFQTEKKIPVIIDFKNINPSGGVNFIEKEIKKQLETNDHFSLAIQEIKEQLEEGNFIIIFDHYNEDIKNFDKINSFIESYDNIRFIKMKEEKQLSQKDQQQIRELIEKTQNDENEINIFLPPMSKNLMREMVDKIIPDADIEKEMFLEKLISYFNGTHLPRTPLTVSLIITICNQKSIFVPVNQSKILEQFMEILLEKLSPDEINLQMHDFESKEYYLSFLASKMIENDRFYFSEEEFNKITEDYHSKKSFDLKGSRFDKIFFKKGILTKTNGDVAFRFECFIKYYTAKYATTNEEFYNKMIDKKNYLNFSEEINYYSGLVRNDIHLLQTIQNYLLPEIEQKLPEKYIIPEDSIKLQINEIFDEIKRELGEEGIPTDIRDDLTDKNGSSKEYKPEKITKLEDDNSYRDAFILATQIFGNIIKNSEQLDGDIKEKALDYFMKSCCIQLTMFNKHIEYYIKHFSKDIIINILKHNNIIDEKIIEENKKMILEAVMDFIKILVPISMQNYILDVVGTPKLNKIIKERYDKTPYTDSEKFFYLALYCDLKEEEWDKLIDGYIKSITSKDALKILQIKFIYYYIMNHFGKRDNKKVEATISQINLKLYKKPLNNEKIIKELKNQKRSMGKDME